MPIAPLPGRMTKARLRILWLLPVAFALHELEEWNILRWYHENWTNMQPEQMSPAIVQAWLGFITLLGFAWTFVGTRLPNPRLAAHVVMFFFMFLPFGHTVRTCIGWWTWASITQVSSRLSRSSFR